LTDDAVRSIMDILFSTGRCVISPPKIVPLLIRHRALLAVGAGSLMAGLALSLVAAHFLKPVPIRKPPPAPIIAPPVPPEPSFTPVPEPEPAPTPAPAPESSAPPAPAPAAALPAPAASAPMPAWQAFAVPARAGKALVAVIIDDMGVDRRRSARVAELPGPLTLSYMTYAPHAAEQAAAAHAHGHELMMHMPMQPLAALDAGPDVLSEQLPAAELRRRVEADLDRFPGFVGINNHMGSRFTAYAPGMKIVMQELHRRGLLFIDSMTTPKSVGMAEAREAGVPTARRNIFLDDVEDQASVARQLAKAEEQARSAGSVIVIGHPHDGTIAALAAWLPTLEKKGITLVPVTAVVKAREGKAGN
jgi:polysaccharide deacetylase 2 family uncharacterized protein YibQ